jgi:hypothetical protein
MEQAKQPAAPTQCSLGFGGLEAEKSCPHTHTGPRGDGDGQYGRDPDLVRVLAAICPGLVALGALMHHPAAPAGSPYTQDQMEVASSPNK